MLGDLFEMRDLAGFIAPVPEPAGMKIRLPKGMRTDINRCLLAIYQYAAGMVDSSLETIATEFKRVQTATVKDVRGIDDTIVSLNGQAASTKALFLEAVEAGQEAFVMPEAYLQRLQFLEVEWPTWPLPLEGEEVQVDEAVQGEGPEADEAVQGGGPEVDEAVQGEGPEADEAVQGEVPEVDEAVQGEVPEADEAVQGEVPEADKAVQGEGAEADKAVQADGPEVDKAVQADGSEVDGDQGEGHKVDVAGQGEGPEVNEKAVPGHRRCTSCVLMVAAAAVAAACVWLML